MNITKNRLIQIVKEELTTILKEEAEEQKYCCIEGQAFKIHDTGTKLLLLGCSPTSCQVFGRMSKEEFQTKLNSGEFKPI